MTQCVISLDGQAVSEAFDCPPDKTVLDAAAAAGWELPYSCKRGTCETCRAYVLAGQTRPQVDADGTALLCQAHAVTPIVIRPTRAERRQRTGTRRIQARFFRMQKVASDVVRVELRFPAGVRVAFRAGQYLNVLLPDEAPRSFSMANVPRSNDGVQLHVRMLPGGLFGGKVLPALRAGDPVELELPYGDFYLRDQLPSEVILLAGGTGFAPIQSMLEEGLPKYRDCSFHLYWGARTAEGLYALDQIRKWEAKFPHLRFTGVISEAPGDQAWRQGLVHQAVADDFGSLCDAHVYACGAPAMVSAARQIFINERMLPPASFFSDAFVSTASRTEASLQKEQETWK